MSWHSNDVIWPCLSLTPLEAEYVGYYRTDEKPGVRYRTYPVDLQFVTNVPGQQSVLDGKYVPSGRYTRVFAMRATGALPWFKLSMRTNNDEILVEPTNVATLLGLPGAGFSFAGPQTTRGLPQFNLAQPAGQVLTFEPNIVLPGATNLIVEAEIEQRWIDLLDEGDRSRAVLHLLFFVWEFPDVLENLAGPMRRKDKGSSTNKVDVFNGKNRGGR